RLVKSDALIRATDDADIFAIAGSLSLAIAKGGTSGGSTAVSIGLAIAVNEIAGDTVALVKSSTLTWEPHAHGDLSIVAEATGSNGRRGRRLCHQQHRHRRQGQPHLGRDRPVDRQRR